MDRIRPVLIAYLFVHVLLVLPWAGWQAWNLVGNPFPGFLIQPTLQISPYNSDADAQQRDRILTCEGRAVSTPDEIMAMARQVGVGGTLHFEVNRNGRRVAIAQRVRLFSAADFVHGFVAMAGVGLSFMLVGLFLVLKGPRNPQSLYFALACATWGSFLALYFDFNLEQRLLWLSFPPYAVMGSSFLSFAMVFPAAQASAGWVRRHASWPTIAGCVAVAVLLLTWLTVPHDQPGSFGHELAYTQLVLYTMGFAVGMLSIGVACLIRFWRADALARQQIWLVLVGSLVAFLPFSLGWAIPDVFWHRHFLPLDLTLIWCGVFPVIVAYGIVRHRLFDMQVIVKRSVTYLLVVTILVGVYLTLISAVGLLVLDSKGTNLVATLVIAFAFQPLRSRLQSLVDKLFFREAYDVQCAVEEAAEALTSILDLDEVLARLESTITGTMHPEAMAILLAAPEADSYVVVRSYGDLQFPHLKRSSALIAEVQANRHILSSALLATSKKHTVSGNLQAASAELLVPMFFQDRLIGVLLLDQKMSHTPYNETDLSLLGTLAGQAALAIENAQKHRVIQQLNESLEERIQQRTRDLEEALSTLRQTQAQLLHNEKMAAIGILAGGMAHEINNPTTIVHGHLELLADYLADLELVWQTYDLAELTPESAAAIAAVKARCQYDEVIARVPDMIHAALTGTRRIREIVADLRTFSADINRDEVPAGKLAEGLRATVNLVQSLFKRHRPIETLIRPLPSVTVNAGQINQVISNLLINAMQATGPDGHVSLTAELLGGELIVTVCDDGHGIPSPILPKIFDPFFTTKGIGEGMGLGLSISYALVKAHGGRIEVESTEGAGATFRVFLPVSQPAAAKVVQA